MRASRVEVLRWLALVVGCFSMGLSGSVFAFSAYSNAIKATFNYTQSTVELLASMCNFNSLGLPAGFLYEKAGPRWVSAAGLGLTFLGYMMLWGTTMMTSFYHSASGLMTFYFAVADFGAVFNYMSSMMTNMRNFPPKYRGTVVGVLDSAYSAGPAIVSLIYGQCFTNGYLKGGEQFQNLGGFFLMMAICFAVVGSMGVGFLVHYPYNDEERQSLIVSEDHQGIQDHKVTPDDHPLNDEINLTGIKLLKNIDFHCFLWSFMFCAGIQLTFQNNLTTYLKSFEMEEFSTMFTVMLPVAGTLSKIFVGVLSDILIQKMPRAVLLMNFTILQTIVLTICIFHANSLTVLTIATLGVGLSNGATWCLSCTLTSEMFGLKYFGRNWSWVMLGNAIGGLILPVIFGEIYVSNITIVGETYCYGQRCFTLSFVIMAVLSFCSILLHIALVKRRWKRHNG